jgi:predicted Zn-dependent protease
MSQVKNKKLLALALIVIAGGAFWLYNRTIPTDMEYRSQAATLAAKQDWNSLEKLAQRWSSHHPKSGMSYAATGDVYRMRGNYAKAAAEYATATFYEKENPQLHALLGIMMLETGAFDKAIDACMKSTRLASNYPDGWYCLSLAYAETGKPQEATDALRVLAKANQQLHETARNIIKTHTCKQGSLDLRSDLCSP